VAKKQGGLLLVGPGRSGKSTLAVALARAGFAFLSDHRTFCSWRNGKLSAWGLATTLKLRDDAASAL
jgi:serine kinase of HPr protein (carbohydrate metabolism regulator)